MKYASGYFFVKAAKVLAVLTVFIGFFKAFASWKTYEIIERAASFELTSDLNQEGRMVCEALVQAEAILVNNGVNLPAKQTPLSWAELEFSTEADFQKAEQSLSEIEANSALLKASLLQTFLASSTKIRSALERHAQELNQLYTPKANTASATATLPGKSIYQTSNDNSANENLAALRRAEEFFKVILNSSEKPESRSNLQTAIGGLKELTAFFKAWGVRDLDVQPTSDEPAQTTPKAGVLAAQMEAVQRTVAGIITENWRVDLLEDALRSDLEKESKSHLKARSEVNRIKWEKFVNVIEILLSIFVIVFFMMVTADLVEAILDNSVANTYVADRYKAAE